MVTRRNPRAAGGTRKAKAPASEAPFAGVITVPPEVSEAPKSSSDVPPPSSWPSVAGHFDLAHALTYVDGDAPIRFDEFDIPYLRFSTRPEKHSEASLRIDRDHQGNGSVQFGAIGNEMGWATLNISLDKDLLLSRKFFSYMLEMHAEKRMVITAVLRVHPEKGGWIDTKLRSQIIGPEYPRIADVLIMDLDKFDLQEEFRDPVLIFYFPLTPFSVEIRKILVQ
ncbi:hypothetical protein PMI04_009675 [Sphingobium sp. AP49]|uniref:hypothetical protein n=1 Tax=Sphingobium sp. AP49 TaxID=1144307 RepID=UPI00026EC87B|nr:hypothetical protein [Sphingobium sp. AP49]WHO40829.1 hypothetical protein PMI04_009675 [Sphingobium sp. AP49]